MEFPIAEMLDRRGIVQLKMERIDAEKFQPEFQALVNDIATRYVTINPEFWPILADMSNELYEINGKIWDLEADIRSGKEGKIGLEEVGRRALAIRDLNNQRVRIKNEVVHLTGSGFADIKKDHASA